MPRPFPGPQTEEMQAVAKKLGVVLVVPLFEKRALGLYHNSAAIIDADGSMLGTYRKMHIPDDPQFYEKFYFTPGDLGFPGLGHGVWAHRGADLLGPMVSGRGASDRAAGGAYALLSHGHRLVAAGEGSLRAAPVRQLGNDSTGPRRGQRRFCRGGEPLGVGTARRPAGDGVLGAEFCRRSVGQIIAQAASAAMKWCSRTSTRPRSKRSGMAGRFCETGGSTLIRGLRNVISIKTLPRVSRSP